MKASSWKRKLIPGSLEIQLLSRFLVVNVRGRVDFIFYHTVWLTVEKHSYKCVCNDTQYDLSYHFNIDIPFVKYR